MPDRFRAPEARIDGYAPLRSYACIGDGRTVALIAEDGAIDWFPIPQLDSPPTLAALLDERYGGRFELQPESSFEISREYVPETNVLRTTFRTESGTASVTDSLNVGVAGRLPWTELARRIDGLSGNVRFRWEFRATTRDQSTAGRFAQHEDGISGRIGHVVMTLIGADAYIDGQGTVAGIIDVSEGHGVTLALAAASDEPIHHPRPAEAHEGVDRTIASWQRWSAHYDRNGRWVKQVQRSALALKLLVHAPSGAIAAAATSSLPESSSGGKNWDYRFAWIRDAAYSIRALIRFGLREETHAALAWILDAVKHSDGDVRIFYDLAGRPRTGVTLEAAPGWRGIARWCLATGPATSSSSVSSAICWG